MYRRDDIDRVRAATNLVDLVAGVTTVKRQGRAYVAVCPFHQEKSPSLSLDPARGLYHCFGCGKGGDVFTFIQETQGLDFNESLELLARHAGIQLEVDPGAARQRGERDQMVEAVRHAADFYHRTLKNDPDAGQARSYLRGRGIDVATVDEYRIGFAPEGDTWGALVKELRGAGIKDRTMEQAGLVRRGGGRLYDIFRRRVLFPIHDLPGEPVGFGGRGLEGVTPKYLNSPDSRLYQKSRLLYGLHRAKGAIARAQEAVVVEGYFDVIACNRAGIETSVATCGTALGEEHFDLLRRFTDRVVLAFDSDAAGGKAALRGDDLRTPVDLDLDLRIAEMPDGLDPADLIQAGRGSELSQAVKASRPLLQFRIEREVERFDLREPEAKARAVRRLVPLLARVGDEIARSEYVRYASGLIGIEPAVLDRAVRGGVRRPSQPVATGEAVELSDPIQRELLRVILANPVEIADQDIEPELFAEGVLREAFESVAPRRSSTASGVPLDISDLNDSELLQRLALDPRPLPKDPAEVLARARNKAIEGEIDALKQEMTRLDPTSQTHSDMLRRVIALEQERRN